MDAARRLSMLVCSDLHNSQTGLDWFCELAQVRRPNLVVCLGDIITAEPLRFLKEALAVLRALAPASFVIPGNWDPGEGPVEMDRAAFDGMQHLHKRAAWLGGYSFAGLGGSITTPLGTTPLERPDEGFADGFALLLPTEIWVLHQPLCGFRDDPGSGAQTGSESLFALWKQQEPKPLLALSGHIHEAVGSEEMWGTVFVNPGSLRELSAAWVKLDGAMVDVEMVQG